MRGPVRWLALGWLVAAAAACADTPTKPSTAQARELWTHADAAGGRALPHADDELAVFTTAFARRVVALDARTGALRWQRDLPGGPGLPMTFANVLVYSDLVLVPAWELYALDRRSGQIRWTLAPDEEYPAAASVAVDGDRVISPGSFRHLYAVNARTGTLLWKTNLNERPFWPIVDGGVVYLGTRGYIGNTNILGAGHAVALRADNGQILWKVPIPDSPDTPWRGGINRSGALTPDLFVVSSTNGRVYGIDRSRGEVRWEYRGSGPFESGVAILDGVAVVASLTGDIVGLDVNTGTVRWRTTTGGSSVTNQITRDGGCAYISVAAIWCVDAAGKLLWDHGGASNGGPSYLTPVRAAGGRLFAGSDKGFHALASGR